ncbi:MAG TPA: MFS transporter [Solirubrobacteraceae bacterium]|jgi:MFS family permease
MPGRYRAALAVPHVRLLAAAATLHGVAAATAPLPLVLLVADRTGSYGSAGVVSGAYFVGTALSAPIRGRAVDRFGALRVILPLAIADSAAFAAIVALAIADAGTGALFVAAALAGLLMPPSVSALRTLWSRLTRTPSEQQAANALQSVVLETVNIVGPLLGGALAAVASPAAALGVSSICMLLAGLAFALSPPAREFRPARVEHSRLGPLASRGIRTLVLLSLPGGAAVGILEIAAPAFADDHGSGAAGAIPLAVMAAGSIAGALLYGARTWTAPAPVRFLRLHALLALGIGLAAVATSVPVLAALLLLVGLTFGPINTTTFGLLDDVAPPGTTTEALTWLISAFSAGAAGGSALGGAVHEAAGADETFLTASAVALVTFTLLAARRRTLDATPAAGV